jgi:phage terminase large subunit-like protein
MRIIAVKNITAVDLAAADTSKADFTEVWTAGAIATGDILFWERWAKRGADPVESMQEYFRQMAFYKSAVGIIERNRFEFLKKTLKRLVPTGMLGNPAAAQRILSRTHTVYHGTDKEDRIKSGITGLLQAHKLWFPDHWDDVRNFLLLYPAVDHDDIGDVIEMIVSNAVAPRTTFIDKLLGSGRLGRSRKELEESPQDITHVLANRTYNIWTGVASAPDPYKR